MPCSESAINVRATERDLMLATIDGLFNRMALVSLTFSLALTLNH